MKWYKVAGMFEAEGILADNPDQAAEAVSTLLKEAGLTKFKLLSATPQKR